MNESTQQYMSRILGYQQGKKPLAILKATPAKLEKLVKKASSVKLKKRPESDKWSVGEILAHLADSELVMSFRFRLVLGSNGTAIQAFDQDIWAKFSNYAKLDPRESMKRFTALREANIRLLSSIPREMWDNFGMHSERGKETVTRMAEMLAGHDINHVRQVEELVGGKRR